MPLSLTLVGGHGAGERATRMLRLGTLSIGRAAGNDWVLADPERHLSKTHCMITAADGRYLLTDVSTNGVFVNGATTRVPRDGQVELTDGDEIRFGEYVLTVTETVAAAPIVAHSAPVAAGVRRADPLAGPADVVPDPLGGEDALLDPFLSPPGAGFVHPIAAPPPVLRASDPFDLADENHRGLGDDGRRGSAEDHHRGFAGGGARGLGNTGLGNVGMGGPGGISDDDLFRGVTPLDNWQGPSQPDNVDAPMQAFTAPPPVAVSNFDDLDIDALLGDTPPAPAGFGAAPALHPPVPVLPPPVATPVPPPAVSADPFADPEPAGGVPAPVPVAVAPVARAPAPVLPAQVPAGPVAAGPTAAAPAAAAFAPPGAAPAAGAADAAALLAAFLDGAGAAGLALGPDPEAALRSAGTVFRVLVEGLRQVLMSRAAIKNEFRVEQTMLRARDNNALKFAVTTEDAIAALLQPSRPGYKAPLDSAREAFDDVRAHEMAVMAGVQTALLGLLRRFEPGALEKRLQPGMLGNLLPGARKARTWELFCATYKDIAREAEDDFQSVFGREFAQAYDAQIRKL
jgi:type VI secretion system protein